MANEKYISGWEGTLAHWDGTAYKPVGCLTSSAYQSTMNMIDKVNMCTQGQTVQSPGTITRSVQIEGEVIDTTSVGGTTAMITIEELYALQEASRVSKVPNDWRLSRGPFGYKYFKGFLSDLSDSYPAEGDATFSATMTVQENPTEVDPHQ
ncbi:hypothetical protein ACR79R_20080 [Sphingobacterium spiritivorum]|uniref:hypothetical protein n=1 Tax=Sphingobacterium spiritivorum TaxID=258 RepID=UPI003DA45066